MRPDITIADEYSESIEDELLAYFETLTSKSLFTGNIWFFDKLKRSEGHANTDYKIFFGSITQVYLDKVRFWVLLRLRDGGAVKTQSTNISLLVNFFSFLVTEAGTPKLSDVGRLTVEAFEDYLASRKDFSKATKEGIWGAMNGFFRDLQGWPGMPAKMPVPQGNPFVRRELDRKNSQRLIPDTVLEQLDEAYRDLRLPLEDRLTYWIIRSIPSRASEVCSIELDCLRPYEHGGGRGFILTMLNWKQSANQHKPRKILIHLLDEGHGKFLLDMIREQQKVAKDCQALLPEKARDHLMVSPKKRDLTALLKGDRANKIRSNQVSPFVLTRSAAIRRMKKVVKLFNITGPDDDLHNALTHAYRHNGITERLYEGFSYVEIRDMSGHKGNQMLTTAYVHVNDEEIKARAKKKREKGEQGPPVLFRGRIMNMTPEKEAKLLSNPRAYRIGDLGICSDITSCGSDLYECLDCDYLVPDADNEDYYVAEADKWSARVTRHKESGNKALEERAIQMAFLHGKQLDRIRLSTEMCSDEDDHGN
jgi:integrase